MRYTVGWGANKAAKSLRSTRFASVPIIGTGTIKGLDRAAKGSFDVRGSEAFKNIPFGGVNAGQAQKGGYQATLKEKIESRTKYASGLTGRGLTGEEDKTITQAEKNNTVAQEQHEAAKTERDNAVQEVSRQKDEVARLEKARDEAVLPESKTQIEEKLTTARQNLTTATEKLQSANQNMEGKATEAKNAKDLEDKTKKSMGYKDEEGKKTVSASYVQGKYAGNLQRFGLGLASNTDAAKKIKKEAGKSDADKQLDSIKKLIEKASKEEKEEKPKEEKSKEPEDKK